MQQLSPTFAQPSAVPITFDFERLRLLMLNQPFTESRPHNWEAACYQYRCFLGLKQRYPSLLLVPPPAALQLWHIHILDTRAYPWTGSARKTVKLAWVLPLSQRH